MLDNFERGGRAGKRRTHGARRRDAGAPSGLLGDRGSRAGDDGRNRQRFAEDGQLLGSWISASTVLGPRSLVRSRKEGRRLAGR
ncbi:MAG: hypothetical protein ACREMZ_12385 [Gemmatimonadales bacterium]